MKLKEVLQKVTENLEVEKDLKIKIKSAEKNVEVSKKKLADMQDELVEGYASYDELKAQLIGELNLKAESVESNLNSYFKSYDNDNYLNLEFKFMGNKYSLLSDKYAKTNNEELHDLLDYSSPVEEMFNKYLQNGNEVLNIEDVEKLVKINELYNKNPKKVSAGFEKIKVESIVKKFEEDLKVLKEEFEVKFQKLEKVEEKIEKAKVFKSPLMKKLFSKREKLEDKQNKLFDETEELGKSIKAIEMELADRSEIENDAKNYVNNEINCLQTILSIVKDFEVAKYRLFTCKNTKIDCVKMEIDRTSKELSNSENNLEDLKSMLKMNRKVNKETIAMAFKDKQFLDEINNSDLIKIAEKDKKAYDLLQTKYDQIIATKIKKMM